MRGVGLALLALLACTGLAACDGGEDDASGAPAGLSFVVRDSGDGVAMAMEGEPRAGLTTIRLRNESRGREHEAQLVRVEGEHPEDAVLSAFDAMGEGNVPTPHWLRPVGGTGTVSVGGEATATLVLEPGAYYAIDTVTSEELPHVRFDVTGETGDEELPDAEATVTAEEYSFHVDGLRAGLNEVRFENHGEEIHQLVALPVVEGSSVADVRRFLSRGAGEGGAPVDFRGIASASAFDGGSSGNVQLRLERGRHVLVCFISDRDGGPRHGLRGMITEVAVE